MNWSIGIGALALGLSAPEPAPAAPAEARPAQAKATLDESLAALNSIDAVKLHSDKAYAETLLGHVGTAIPAARGNPEAVASLELLRATALATLERSDEAVAAARRAIAATPANGSIQAEGVFQSARAERPLAALELLEAATRSVPAPEQQALLRQGLSEELVFWLRRKLNEPKAGPEDVRLARALLTLRWPSPERPGLHDGFRVTLIKALLAKDPAGARKLLAEITDPARILPLIASRRFDPLFASDAERLARLDSAIRAFDKGSAERLRLNPADPDLALERAQFLRGVGREQEALAVLAPWLQDLKRVEAAGEDGLWLVNEAAYSLRALGRAEEAVAAMEKIIALDITAHPYLISMAINHGEILNSAKRHSEAARYAENLFATAKSGASPYGQMWMWSIAACAHVRAGRPAAAAPWLKRLRDESDKNEAAHMRALLCTGDLDPAEALLLKRLEGEDRDSVLVQLQDYSLQEGGRDPALDRKMALLRQRPAVAAAIARYGRVLKLPLSKVYWGDV